MGIRDAAPSTPARQPDPATGAVVTPISLAPRSPRTASASTRASSTRAAGNPTRAALEALRRLAGGRAPRPGVRQRARRRGQRPAPAAARRPGAARQRRLRRHVPADRQGVGTLGFPWTAVDLTDLDALAADWPDDTRMVWLETPTNPLLTCVDIEAIAADGPRPRRARRRRQHVRHPVPAAAADARRRHRRALGHEVPRRPQRRRRRVPRRRRRRAGRPAALHPERGRRGPGAVRLLPRAARREDARPCAWSGTARTPGRSSTCSSATPRSSGCCTRSCPTIPGTPRRPSRCATSAGW